MPNDYKFKKGDVCRVLFNEGHNCPFEVGSLVTVDENDIVPYCVQGDARYAMGESELELITDEPQYEKLHPKVGDKFRVVKGSIYMKEGEILIVAEVDDSDMPIRALRSSLREGHPGHWQRSETVTTEYLEPVEEESPKRYIDTSQLSGGVTLTNKNSADLVNQAYNAMTTSMGMRSWPIYTTDSLTPVDMQTMEAGGIVKINNNKTTIMQRLTSALKRALSADKQALYKVGIINGGLELSSAGREAYINALFQNEGDHKAAMKEMVEAAQEEIEDNKE